jgi:predicted transglutaminase-like cysteine proteinase
MWQALIGHARARSRSLAVPLTACAAFIVALGWGQARAQQLASIPAPTLRIESLGAAKLISGWVEFCHRVRAECAVDPDEPLTLTLTPKTWSVIVATNRVVNAAINPITDQEHWGVGDLWDIPEDGNGDCEDYQLLKRRLLVKAGLPRRALRMTVVIDDKGEGHAVLMVRTDRGDFILDNKQTSVLPWNQTEYRFVKRESDDGRSWVSLGGVESPLATANY